MFDRTAKRFTDIHQKESDRFGGDSYAAKWLTQIFNPEFLIGKALKLETPEIRTTLGVVDWSEMNMDKKNPKEVF